MEYRVSDYIFEKNPDVIFAVVIGKHLRNEATTDDDSKKLSDSEAYIRQIMDHGTMKNHSRVAVYRDALREVGINPNKFMNSVEAMCKRVLKNGSLPRINALVDQCNSIALNHVISLGGHDLKDIHEDLEVRLSDEKDVFLPFGEEKNMMMPVGEMVFTSGNQVQTRNWLWRQSELGKMTLDSTDVFFQLVGFKGFEDSLDQAVKDLESVIANRFGGTSKSYKVTSSEPLKF